MFLTNTFRTSLLSAWLNMGGPSEVMVIELPAMICWRLLTRVAGALMICVCGTLKLLE